MEQEKESVKNTFRGSGKQAWTQQELDVLDYWKDEILSGKYSVYYVANILCKGSLYTRTATAIVWQFGQQKKVWAQQELIDAHVA